MLSKRSMAFGRSTPAAHPDAVLRAAMAATPGPAVLLTGALDRAGVEPWYVEHALEQIAERALGEGARDFNLDRMRADEAGADRVVGRAETLPTFATRRVVAVSDVDRFRAADQERILAYLERPAPTTTLLLSSTRLDRRTSFGKALENLPQVWRFRKLDPPELASALVAYARSLSKRLLPAAAEEIVRRAGEDLRLLRVEVQKLALFVGDGRESIDERDVAEATAGAGIADVFAYADRLGRGDLAGALERLGTLLEGGASAYELIGGLAWHFRSMLRAKGGGKSVWIRPEIAEAARSFPTASLLVAHREIYRADGALKGAHGPNGLRDEAVMDRLTRRICALRG